MAEATMTPEEMRKALKKLANAKYKAKNHTKLLVYDKVRKRLGKVKTESSTEDKVRKIDLYQEAGDWQLSRNRTEPPIKDPREVAPARVPIEKNPIETGALAGFVRLLKPHIKPLMQPLPYDPRMNGGHSVVDATNKRDGTLVDLPH